MKDEIAKTVTGILGQFVVQDEVKYVAKTAVMDGFSKPGVAMRDGGNEIAVGAAFAITIALRSIDGMITKASPKNKPVLTKIRKDILDKVMVDCMVEMPTGRLVKDGEIIVY